MKLASLAAVLLLAQAPPAEFEVASIKLNKSGPTGPSRVLIQAGDRVTITKVTVKTLIQVAYNLPPQQVVGGPGWLDDDRFDIVAKAERRAPTAELREMLRHLVADRFKLTSHSEDRITQGYALVVARRDGKLGSGLRRVQSSCATLQANAPADPDPCGMRTMAASGTTGTVALRGTEFNVLMGVISRDTKRPVIDKTGLTGYFDFDLRWTPQAMLQRPVDRNRFPNIDPDGPSIFTALEEQLGLKLESARTAESVIVIDAIERPTPD